MMKTLLFLLLGNVLDVSCNQDASSLAFIQKANNKIFTAAVGSQIYQNSTTLSEVRFSRTESPTIFIYYFFCIYREKQHL